MPVALQPIRPPPRHHFAEAARAARNAGEHAAGTFVIPMAAVAIAPAVLVPYAGLIVIPALNAAARYAASAPALAMEEAGRAAKHVLWGVAGGLWNG